MNYDPYQPPSAPVSASYSSGDGQISPLALQHLVRTQPWVRLVSIAGLIMTGIIMVVTILSFVGLGKLGSQAKGAEQTGYLAGAAVMTIIFSLLYFYPLIKLLKYAAAIRRLRISQRMADFEDAMDQQRSFWKFVGILTLIGIVFFGLALLSGGLSASYSRF